MIENISTPSESRYASINMSAKDWQTLGLSLIPAALMSFGDMIHNEFWLNVYTPLFHLTVLMLAVFAAGKHRPDKTVAFLLTCDCALIILGFFHHNLFLCCANCLVIPTLTALAMMSACKVNPANPLSTPGVWNTLLQSARGLFEYIPVPFVKLLARNGNQARNWMLAILSLCICLPVLIVVLALLSSADTVFLYWCGTLLESVDSVLTSPSALRIPLMLIAALMIFSWMFTLRRPSRPMQSIALPTIPAIFPSILLPMLNAVYGVFVYIQFTNLFGGAETAAMTGGYAEYARSGFFQLVAVACINLAALAIALRSSRSGWIRAMAALLIVLTGVILYSALWRMRLYIDVYGLSVLRVMTLWGMLLIAVLLAIAVVALFRKNLPTFTVGLTCALVLWVGLNAVDIDRLIAEYNVRHYLSGDLEQIDREYLRSLSPSAQAVVDEFEQMN